MNGCRIRVVWRSLTDEEAAIGEEHHGHGLLNVHQLLLDEPRR